MSTFDQAKHPRKGGHANTGNAGHFAAVTLDEADVDLDFLDEGGAGGIFGEVSRPHENETPVEVDTQLAELDHEYRKIQRDIASAVYSIHIDAGDRKSYSGGRAARWGMSDQKAIDHVTRKAETDQTYQGRKSRGNLQRLDEARERLRENQHLGIDLNNEFEARGGWSRAFLVSGGHVHRSQDCSTCNRDGAQTAFHWMPNYSGQDEKQIVADAGHRACTVCFPSAPVGDALSLPTKMFTPDEEEAAAAKAKRDAEKAAKAAKAIANAPTVTGEPIEVHEDYSTSRMHDGKLWRARPKTLKTERAATLWFTENWMPEPETFNYGSDDEVRQVHQQLQGELDHVVEQLAAKKGVKVDELRTELKAKAIKKNGYRWGM